MSEEGKEIVHLILWHNLTELGSNKNQFISMSGLKENFLVKPMPARKRVKKGPQGFPHWILSLIIPLGGQNLLLCTTGYWWYRQMLVPGDQLILTEVPLKIREWGQILFQWKSGECLDLGRKKGEIHKRRRHERNLSVVCRQERVPKPGWGKPKVQQYLQS